MSTGTHTSVAPDRDGHVILGLNALVYGYVPSAWQSPLLGDNDFQSRSYWQRIGRMAEKARLDAFFLADGLALGNPSYDANPIRLDPTSILAAVAAATEHIGLVATASTTFNDPVDLARRILTLDHVSGGRAGWNLVTTRDSASAANFGLDEVTGRSDRYARGAEFAELVTAIWAAAGTGARSTTTVTISASTTPSMHRCLTRQALSSSRRADPLPAAR
jgi:alkanesulfonate monooxygenase SsuD/methylene tetrahydromethanopterin reductase-like flavin-dependent oxidoreductase (luciferase family)